MIIGRVAVLRDIVPGDMFYMTGADIYGPGALLLWTVPTIAPTWLDIGYLDCGTLHTGWFDADKEAYLP